MLAHRLHHAPAYVWILSGVVMSIYATLLLIKLPVPGVEQLIAWLSSLQVEYIFLAAFLIMFIEGLYIAGNFVPGSSSIVVLTILSQLNSPLTAVITIFCIFLGWSLAGVVNIFLASRYQKVAADVDPNFVVHDNLALTWFPAFRANYEVAQVAAGGSMRAVLISSIRVKALVSIGMIVVTYVASLILDLNSIDNSDGAGSLYVIAAICITVGVIKLRTPRKI